MNQLKQLKTGVNKQQQNLIQLIEKVSWLKGLGRNFSKEECDLIGIKSADPKKAAIDLFIIEEKQIKFLLASIAEHAIDPLDKMIKDAAQVRGLKLSVENIIPEILKLSTALSEILEEIDNLMLRRKFLPISTKTSISIAPNITASPGFRCVKKGGEVYCLTATEALVIEFLVNAFWAGHHDVSFREVCRYINGNPESYDHVSKIFQSKHSKLACKALIKTGTTTGTIRFNVKLPSVLPISA